jgi:hypothetical protein
MDPYGSCGGDAHWFSDCGFKVFHGPDLAVPDEDVKGAVDLIFSAILEACTVP